MENAVKELNKDGNLNVKARSLKFILKKKTVSRNSSYSCQMSIAQLRMNFEARL